ncbi:MAG TPA: MBL fold metallo-hydrolase [Candidatus Edwardsbacteria bacterium]|nr:MBL fold metallo-hydrolase [Candidatus Edwardsbacteria bacterium]
MTYVANDGFLVKTSHHKVLIDALFGGIKGDWCDQPSDSVANEMITGIAPFDHIDVVLVTHAHVDHFNSRMTIEFLQHNPKAMLVCPGQADSALRLDPAYANVSSRIVSLKPGKQYDTSFTVGEIGIRGMRFDHSSYYEPDPVTERPRNIHAGVENIGYLVKMDGFTIFHSGDDTPENVAQYAAYNIGKDSIDIAFLDRSFYTAPGLSLIGKYIPAKNVVLMHIATGSDNFFKSLKSRPGEVPQIMVFNSLMTKKTINK